MANRTKESAAGTHFFGVTSSVSTEQMPVLVTTETVERLDESKSIERAVLAHIRAIRALGRDQINTEEIADALNLPVRKVNSVVAQLKESGVQPL